MHKHSSVARLRRSALAGLRRIHGGLSGLSRVALAGLAGVALVAAGAARAETSLRWTLHDDTRVELGQLLERINAQTGYALTEADFVVGEDRALAFDHYRRYDQVLQGIGVKGMSIRVWSTAAKAPTLLQAEARVEARNHVAPAVTELEADLGLFQRDTAWTATRASALVAASEDARVRGVQSETIWEDGHLVRLVTVKAHRGAHHFRFDLVARTLLRSDYAPYERADLGGGGAGNGEFSVPALIYPIYEEYGTETLTRRAVDLKHLLTQIHAPTDDPYAALRTRKYLYSQEDQIKGETPEGRADGFWTMRWLRAEAAALNDAIPLAPNVFGKADGVLLQGRYATVSIYPDAFTAFPGITIPKRFSNQLLYNWTAVADSDDYEITPTTSYFGKTLADASSALNRDATRHPQHDAATYINNGFDEVQVYYAVNQLFDSLRPMGFSDPYLSERAFNAFLFDPDVESKDNAFYTDDTINFTTYSPSALNAARDNTTIWHELGHGVMDRLMGTRLQLADTGGLSEGMADFVAELVLRETNGDAPFPGQEDMRIINGTGFFLTNEVHDDGEAYGGTMKAILDRALAAHGRQGLVMVTDVVLEAMRLSRDHPGLTAQDWFDHIFFADELGRPGLRAPGELHDLIQAALLSRNFAAEADRSKFTLSYQDKEVVAGAAGSRGNEVKLTLHADETSSHQIALRLDDGQAVQFKYPVEVKVFFNSGPLQGAIHWEGEESEPALFTITGPGQTLTVPLTVRGTCDSVNRTDGTCSDFAYVQIFNAGETRPVAKKRFYLRIKTL